MNENTFPIPRLLCISIRFAVSVSCLTTIIPAAVYGSFSGNQASAWQCISTIHNDWRCSPGPGQPFSLSLEEISQIRGEIEGSLPNTLSGKNKKADKTTTDKILQLSGEKSTPMRSLAEQDWVERLTNRSTWSEDQRFMPSEDVAIPIDARGKITPEEAEGSVLLSSWLKRAKQRTAWPEQRDHENISRLESTRQLHGLETRESGQKTVALKKATRSGTNASTSKIDESGKRFAETTLSTDKWFRKASQRSSLSDPQKSQSATTQLANKSRENGNAASSSAKTRLKQAFSSRENNIFDNLLANQQIKHKIAGTDPSLQQTEQKPAIHPNQGSNATDRSYTGRLTDTAVNSRIKPLQNRTVQNVRAPANTGPIIRETIAAPGPTGIRGMLLAHQAQAGNPGLSAVPKSYRNKNRVVTHTPVQKSALGNTYKLPPVEISPAERESKAATPAGRYQNTSRHMPYSMDMQPNRRKWVPENTLPAKSDQPLASAPGFSPVPEQIHLPGNKVSGLFQQPENGAVSASSQSFLHSEVPLTESEMEALPPPVISAYVENAEQKYLAEESLGPELPKYSQRVSWIEIQRGMKADPNSESGKISALKLPPPVSLQDIFYRPAHERPAKALPQEPEPDNRNQGPVKGSEEQHKATKSNEPLNSIERFRRHAEMSDALSQKETKSTTWSDNISAEGLDIPQLASARLSAPGSYKPVQQDIVINSYRDGFSQMSQSDGQASFRKTGFSAKNRPEPNSEEQLAAASEHFITIQWAQANNKDSLLKLKKQFPALRNTQVITLDNQKEHRFILIGNTFTSYNNATQHLRRFPDSFIQRLNPRLRKTAVLKSAVLKKAVVSSSQSENQSSLLPQGKYAIQWFESSDINKVKQIRQQFPNLHSAEIRSIRRNGQLSYVLIQGRFMNNLDAYDKLDALSNSLVLKRLAPKIRPLGSLWDSHPVRISEKKSAGQMTSGSGQRYTIQWLAANEPEIIRQLKNRYDLLRDTVTQQVNDGDRSWYVLLQGNFPSRLAAQQLLSSPELKLLARKLKPRLRPVSDVHKLTRI